jgi:exonuclease III
MLENPLYIIILFIIFALIVYYLYLIYLPNESFKVVKECKKKSIIDKLNDTRGKLGRFHVDCLPCGRARILEDRADILKEQQKKKQNLHNQILHQEHNQERKHETMSFYNTKYVDKNKIFCYNCLMDNPDNEKHFIKNYVYWPSFENPINGPPYV